MKQHQLQQRRQGMRNFGLQTRQGWDRTTSAEMAILQDLAALDVALESNRRKQLRSTRSEPAHTNVAHITQQAKAQMAARRNVPIATAAAGASRFTQMQRGAPAHNMQRGFQPNQFQQSQFQHRAHQQNFMQRQPQPVGQRRQQMQVHAHAQAQAQAQALRQQPQRRQQWPPAQANYGFAPSYGGAPLPNYYPPTYNFGQNVMKMNSVAHFGGPSKGWWIVPTQCLEGVVQT